MSSSLEHGVLADAVGGKKALEPHERLLLDLAHALAREAHFVGEFLERGGLDVVQPEAALDHMPVLVRQAREPQARAALELAVLHFRVGRLALVVGQQVEQARTRIEVERRIERGRVFVQRQDVVTSSGVLPVR